MKDGVFVSYSHKDVDTVEKIVSLTRNVSGKDVWFDHKLKGGENYFSVIANQIIDNKYFVFMVSSNSANSEWCMRELEFAASEKRYIIAVWLEDVTVPPRIRLLIHNTHYINWYSAPENIFSEAVGMAFNGEKGVVTQNDGSGDADAVIPKNKKYFLTDDELKQLKKLLIDEKEEKYNLCFIPENANLLGIAYEFGILTEKDLKKASLYYRASAYCGNWDGVYLYNSLKFSEDSTRSECVSKMIEAAENGSVLALTHVGDNYYFGENGLPVNLEKAYSYFERAARLNGSTAMYYTSYGYRRGEVLPQDFELAYMYALKAKEKGFPRAFRILGFMHEDGDFVEQNLQKAIEYYEEAIKRGDYLSYCYQGYSYGKSGNNDKKIELYRKAVELAEAGEIKSGVPYYRMAIMYDDGDILEVDYRKAVEYYLKAAERKHKNARKWAVPCILKLKETMSEEEKISLLEKAFSLKCEDAAYELGEIERSKKSNSKERISEKGIMYYESGAEDGDIACVLALIDEYSFVFGNERTKANREQAIKWFGFLFANATENWFENWRKYDVLSTYYYAYAIELDYTFDDAVSDREFVLYNFKKSVEESPKHLANIILFAVSGYLFPEKSQSGLKVDVQHAVEVLEFATGHIREYMRYINDTKPEQYEKEKKELKELLKMGYDFIASCYKNGNHVQKNKETAKIFADKASNVEKLF